MTIDKAIDLQTLVVKCQRRIQEKQGLEFAFKETLLDNLLMVYRELEEEIREQNSKEGNRK